MSETQALNVLLAPEGQLQGNGQLRESFHERRARKGEDYPMWFLNSSLVNKFNIAVEDGYEAVVAEDSHRRCALSPETGTSYLRAACRCMMIYSNVDE